MPTHCKSIAKGACPRKAPCYQCTSTLFVLLEISVEIKDHFDFSLPFSRQSRTETMLGDAEAEKGPQDISRSVLATDNVWLCCMDRVESRGRLSMLSYPPRLISPNSNSKLLNHKLTPPLSKA